jgi:hypothetical protein
MIGETRPRRVTSSQAAMNTANTASIEMLRGTLSIQLTSSTQTVSVEALASVAGAPA